MKKWVDEILAIAPDSTTLSPALRAVSLLRPSEGCDKNFAAALKNLATHLITSDGTCIRHSLTSRRYSVWALIRKDLDAAFNSAITSYDGAYERRLLEGIQLSALGREHACWMVSPTAWARAKRMNATDPVEQATKRRVKAPYASGATSADRQIATMSSWDQNIRFAIHSIRSNRTDGITCESVCATLNSLRDLIFILKTFRPKRSREGVFGNQLRDDQTRPQEKTHCELCWRISMRSQALSRAKHPVPNDSNLRKHSDRFCSLHDPSDPRSLYRKDHPYKKAFHHELDALHGRKASEFEFRFSPPQGADTEELRKAAYDLVHAGLHPLLRREESAIGFREKVVQMHRQDMRQTEIARKLGISRQAVHKALKNLEGMLQTRSREEVVDPATGEAFSPWTETNSGLLIAEVLQLATEGFSAPQIARMTGRFKHTILSILRSNWHPMPR